MAVALSLSIKMSTHPSKFKLERERRVAIAGDGVRETKKWQAIAKLDRLEGFFVEYVERKTKMLGFGQLNSLEGQNLIPSTTFRFHPYCCKALKSACCISHSGLRRKRERKRVRLKFILHKGGFNLQFSDAEGESDCHICICIPSSRRFL